MNRFLRSGDVESWSKERAQGFLRFGWMKAWPAGVGFAIAHSLMPLWRTDRQLDLRESALWFGWGIVCGFFWAVVTWWNRERAFRNASGGSSGAAA